VLFAVANLARHVQNRRRSALATDQRQVRRRFALSNKALKIGQRLGEASLAEMDALWEKAKEDERIS